MVGWARRGPELAEVTAVDVTEEPPHGERRFRVS
jgi:hypothetical protein